MSTLSIGQAWDETSQFLRKEARLVVPVALAAFAVPTTLAGWANPGGAPSGGSGMLLALVVLVIVLIGQMTIVALSVGSRESVGTLIGRAAGRVWSPLAAAILILLPVTTVLVLVLAALLGANGMTDPARMTPEALARTPQVAVAVLLMLLVVLIVGVRLFPMTAVAIEEGAGPVALLKRCFALTRGHFLRLMGVLALILIAALVLSGATTTVVGALATLLAGEARPFSLSALLIALADGLASAAVTAVGAALVGRIYVQLNAKG